jgi:glycosyltransferase involved in cell wall biosynthesis
VVLAWADFQPRTAALARALDGKPLFIRSRRLARHRSLIAFRYLFDALQTWRQLSRLDSQCVVAVTPPLPPVLVAWAWCRVHRRRLVVDSHTGAYQGRKWGWSRPLHRWVFRRALVVAHHTKEETDEARGWGVNALCVPDDLPNPGEAAHVSRTSTPRIVVAGSFDANEPVAAVLAAAALLDEVEVRLTGDPARLPPGVRSGAPVNAVFTGYLAYDLFLGELAAADVVGVFTADDPEITYRVNRASFEAIGLGRPLVLSDVPGNRRRFGEAALLAAADPASMAAALRLALNRREELAARSRTLGRQLEEQRQLAVARLRAVVEEHRDSSADRPRAVLLITQHPYPFHTTVRRNVERLVEEGASVDLVCMASTNVPDWKADRQRLRVHRIPLNHRRSAPLRYVFEYLVFLAVALPLSWLLSMRRRYSVVQVDTLPDILVLAALVARWRGARVVLNMLEFTPEMVASRLSVRPSHPVVRFATWLERVATGVADHVIVPSDACARILQRRHVPAAKISVVPNSVDMQPAAADVTTGAGAPVLITHGSLVWRYGVQVAIKALAELRRDWPDLTLRVLGEGEFKPALRRLARELGIANAVFFQDFLPWPDAMAEVRRATVGLVPVIADGYGELMLPTKLFEYVIHGTPVVSSRLPTIAEYFPPDAVAYCAPGDASSLAAQVDLLLRDPARARRQADRAREVVAGLGWGPMSERYLAALGLPTVAQPA